jgi:hypothetical protein
VETLLFASIFNDSEVQTFPDSEKFIDWSMRLIVYDYVSQNQKHNNNNISGE